MRSIIARNVVPRVDGGDTVFDATQSEVSETAPASLTALHEAGRRLSPNQVPAHVLDALEEDLDRVEDVELAVSIDTRPVSPEAIQHKCQRGGVPSTVFASSGTVREIWEDAEPVPVIQWDTDAEFSLATRGSEFRSQSSTEGHDVIVEPTDSQACHDVEEWERVAHVVHERQPKRLTLVSSQATTVADPAPDILDALELDLGEVEEPPRQPIVVPMTDSEGTSVSSSDTESVLGDHEAVEREQAQDVEEVQVGPRLREAFRSLDGVDVGHLFSMRAVLMKSPPAFVKGVYRAGLRVALREILQGREHSDDARSVRGWKLFLLLPRMLLFRPPRGGLIPKQRLLDRFQLFARGEWMHLLLASRECCEKVLSKEDTAGHSRTTGRARADDGVDG